jgi:uncharacterized pyridoxamine 5'-phosphate oxidase family protein
LWYYETKKINYISQIILSLFSDKIAVENNISDNLRYVWDIYKTTLDYRFKILYIKIQDLKLIFLSNILKLIK